ncbi:MAG: hypothetical protein KGZ92_02575 [Firmicutes bacterium]|nr:hypothetical protein [Dethiobacter sp.]MBS3888172.1 hypothetical protein [Bacillota bacterium]MBS4054358.1 hypothetical protein [Thermaerobacter sp.]
MIRDYTVSLSPEQAASAIIETITQEKALFRIGKDPGILLDNYRINSSSGTIISLILTKYYIRVGSFITLAITISNLLGVTTIHVSTGGHKRWSKEGEDFGAGSDFMDMVEKALADYIVQRET